MLALFLKQVLHYTEDTATVIYHGFIFLCYLSPIFGAMLADSSFGKFRTILYVSLVYALGQIILSVGAIGDKTEANDGIKGLPAWYTLRKSMRMTFCVLIHRDFGVKCTHI